MNRIETERIHLIPLTPEELESLLDDPQKLANSLGIPIVERIVDENVRRAIHKKLDARDELTTEEWLWKTYWMIVIKESNIGAGMIGFKGLPDPTGSVEVGYGIHSTFQNKGIVTEALKTLLVWAFSHPNCDCVTATTVVNPASEKVLKKSGFLEVAKSEQFSNWLRFKEDGCLTPETGSFSFHPIGTIFTPHQQAAGTPIQPSAAETMQGTIILDPQFTPALKDLSEFSHIILLYVFDQAQPAKLIVKPFMDTRERGLFATRAPARPNPIGISVVELLSIEGHVLRIKNVDMLNRTPLLDIKPYVPQFDPIDASRIGWLAESVSRLQNTRDDGRFLNPAE